MDFTNKVILITGASGGIGGAAALEFAKQGATIVVGYFSSEAKALTLVKEIKELGCKAIALQCDVSEESEVQAMVKIIIETFGTIDILVNSAGIINYMPFFERTGEQWKRTTNVNLLGMFLCSKYASQEMLKRGGGKIINLASTNAMEDFSPETIDYDSSKAGVISLTRNLAKQLAPTIQVNAVAPGWVDTDMNKILSADFRKEASEKIYLKRFAYPEEIAHCILFLASEQASFVNGSVLKADGGFG